ncbi:hypothetical protein BQ8482_80162 [Mesorhizobium delmotii]|uniref:Uncharacterized protein n=1 Tax=Mesorhizobium delmotii TaxID=1631247 RepID=A0A2P9AWE3_9HYPH|nr:hypothetical protein BQ8482_80162 [Mesorhizobium delmotii]
MDPLKGRRERPCPFPTRSLRLLLVDGDGDQVVFQGASQRPVASVRKQDRLAIGGKQGPQFKAGRDFAEARETAAQIVARHFPEIGDRAFAEMGEFAAGHDKIFVSSSHLSLLVARTPLRPPRMRAIRAPCVQLGTQRTL